MEILKIKSGKADSVIGEASLFTSERTLYASVTAQTLASLVSVKISDIMPLILHDHKGTCKLLER